MKTKNLWATTILFCLFLLSLAAFCGAAEVIKKNLGIRNESFGSMGQSIELLKLMKNNPHQFEYQLTYKTTAGTVIFACDTGKDTITRINKRKNGTGTAEKWQGDALFRLQSAANGGTLNDTRKGKDAGTMISF